jgi:hypothetical protein
MLTVYLFIYLSHKRNPLLQILQRFRLEYDGEPVDVKHTVSLLYIGIKTVLRSRIIFMRFRLPPLPYWIARQHF